MVQLKPKTLVATLSIILLSATVILGLMLTDADSGPADGQFPESFDLPLLSVSPDCQTNLQNCHASENSNEGQTATALAQIEIGTIPQVDGGESGTYVIPRDGTLEYQCTEGREAYVKQANDDFNTNWFQGGATVDGQNVPTRGQLRLNNYDGWEGLTLACFDYDTGQFGGWAGTWAGYNYYHDIAINEPPEIIELDADETQVEQGEEIQIQANTEHEYDAAITYEWSGDGDIQEVGSRAYVEYVTSGSQTVQVRAETSDGLYDEETVNIQVFEEPELLSINFDENITQGETASANIEVDNLGDAEIEWSNGDTQTFTDFTYEEPGQKTEKVEIYNAETGELVEDRQITIIVVEEDEATTPQRGIVSRFIGFFTNLF